MSQPKTPSGEFRFEAVQLREIPAAQFWPRVVCLLAGVIGAIVGGWYFYSHRLNAEEIALGLQTRPTESVVQGVRMNSWRPSDAATFYRADAWSRGPHEGVWLGNSQIYAINQPTPTDQVGPWHLSTMLGWNVFGLNIPNGNFQEYLVLQEFAFTKRKPDWVIMVLVFDKLREDDIRAQLAELASPELYAALRTSDTGQAAVQKLEKAAEAVSRDLQGTTREEKPVWFLGISLQKKCEDWLEWALGEVWPVWNLRGDMRAAIILDLNLLRNWVFQINTRSIRPVLKATYDKNMAALDDALARNKARGVHTLVYIAPLRRDYSAPYEMDKYEAWKKVVQSMASAHGAIYADLDTSVPDNLWGTVNGEDIDFMHYQGAAHKIVAEKLAEIIKQHLSDAPGQGPGGGSGGGTH